MTVTRRDEARQRGLSEWWSEETEYVLQRIERWAAYARGYNRLRPQRLSPGRMTMRETRASQWSISGNNLFEDVSRSPQLHTLKRSNVHKSRSEEIKLNCCGSFDYKSNGNLDSTCLETYRYDHSIYFKTIGDLKRNSPRIESRHFNHQDPEETTEWEKPVRTDSNRFDQLIFIDSANDEAIEFEYPRTAAWTAVDLSKLSLAHDVDGNANLEQYPKFHINDPEGDQLDIENDNVQEQPEFDEDFGNATPPAVGSRDVQSSKKFLNSRRTKSSKHPQRVCSDNNVIWPGVLLTYTKNVDPATSPHRHAQSTLRSDHNILFQCGD